MAVKRRHKKRRGPRPSVTRAVVKRVAERIGRGLTLELALAAEASETVNLETWKKALAAHPDLSPLYQAGKGKFLAAATLRLEQSDELANLRWLMERRYWSLFARRDPDFALEVKVEIPADVLARARNLARQGKAA